MTRGHEGLEKPRAIIHKRILDVAEANPESSIDDIVAEISAATPELVERVLAEYGDPASGTDQHEAAPDEAAPDEADPEPMAKHSNTDKISSNGHESTVDAASLTSKQRETLAAVRERPAASQAEIADELGVTSATVSRRLNEIPDFEWSERERFIENYVGSDEGPGGPSSSPSSEDAETDQRSVGSDDDADATNPASSDVEGDSTTVEGVEAESTSVEDGEKGSTSVEDSEASSQNLTKTFPVESLEDRLAAIENQLQERDATRGSDSLDPELVHKIVHACMESDVVSSEEELAVIEHFVE